MYVEGIYPKCNKPTYEKLLDDAYACHHMSGVKSIENAINNGNYCQCDQIKEKKLWKF